MNANTATIRQLRTDFRSVKRSIEQHGEVVVTDHGEPAYVIRLLPAPAIPPEVQSRAEEAVRLWTASRRTEMPEGTIVRCELLGVSAAT